MRRLIMGAALVATCLITSPVYADLIDVDRQACAGKTDGDKCVGDSDREGVCKPGDCCKLDYSNGTPPKIKCTECLKCNHSAPAQTAKVPEQTAKAPEQAAQEPPPPPTGPTKTEQTTKSGGCAAAGGQHTTTLWILLAGAMILTNLRRRRRPTPTETP
jgi:hypothetical protein